jgi:hypothetical protein
MTGIKLVGFDVQHQILSFEVFVYTRLAGVARVVDVMRQPVSD